jgi:hypothetical protein
MSTSPSLWSRVGPVVVIQHRLWPLLDDACVMRVMQTNRAAYSQWFGLYPVKSILSQPQLQQIQDAIDATAGRPHIVLHLPLVQRCELLSFDFDLHRFPHVDELTLRCSLTPQDRLDAAYFARPPFSTLRCLKLARRCLYSQLFAAGALPASLTHLCFGGYNKSFASGALPSSLTHLALGSIYRRQPRFAQSSLTHLWIVGRFNHVIAAGMLPPTLTHLMLGNPWSEPDDCFNQPFDAGVLPPGLTHLSLGYRYNQPLSPGALPAGLSLSSVAASQK